MKAKFQRDLTGWFEIHSRDLPWRHTTDPYAVLVSEFMLQQTQVATVIAYYGRWMKKFPDIAALAKAPEQDVLSVWQGLGYYSRARNLHRAAIAVMNDYQGVLPVGEEELRSLPGVGEYTAAAVTAFARDQPTAVVDANIARVLVRLTDFQERIDTSAGRDAVRQTALDLQPPGDTGGRVFNSALMELGALICRSGEPPCLVCPVSAYCSTLVPAALPLKAARATTEFLTERVAFHLADGKVFLHQSPGPRWRGLWRLPEIPRTIAVPDHVLTYPITRYRVRLEVVRHTPPTACGVAGFAVDDLANLPMPAPHRRAVEAMLEK